MEGVLKICNYRLFGSFLTITSAMGYVPLAMGYVPLAMGYDVLFVDTRTCNLLYIHWLTNECTWWRLAWPGNKVQCARGGCCPSLINSMLWLHTATVVEGVLRYLGLQQLIYQAGICTTVISINGTFKWCPVCHRLNSAPKSWKSLTQKCDQH